MPLINYIEANGKHHEIEVASGDTIMQGAVDNMIDSLLAECGGACACATCHCYVDEAWLDKIPAAADIEKDLLEAVLEPKDNSRLSCQIVVNDEMEGFTVRLPESQY